MDLSNPISTPTAAATPARPVLRTRRGQIYEPAIGPRLKILLAIIFASVAVLGATGVYLFTITLLERFRGQTYTNWFVLAMFDAHVVLGVLIAIPFLFFGFMHLATAHKRPNRVAVRLGITLFITGIIATFSGLALIQLEKLPQLPTGTISRTVVYILHLVTPVLAVALYVLHRRAGPEIKWKWGYAWGAAAGSFAIGMSIMHSQDPRKWNVKGPEEGEKYFLPAAVHTENGNFIPASVLMMDSYCLKCHADIYDNWFHSAHHFSSFNNPPYLFSVRETRKVALERDGNVRAARWCAGCHDPVPFFSGAFDDPKFDDVNHPTARAGITCTVCHAITNIDSAVGNGAYTIGEPQHYPFATSENPFLQWLNNQTVKAKPDFHKKTFLKPFHKTAEFCSVCHKVSIPVALNHYKEFLRGQDHYTTYLLSGVSGVGTRSFYYPPEAKTNCADCHMPLKPSNDFGSKDFDGSGVRKIHNHIFVGANTGLMSLLAQDSPEKAEHAEGFLKSLKAHTDFLRGTDPEGKDKKMRIDLFGVKEGDSIDGKLIAPLRPELPRLKPGSTYLIEVVIRTVGMGHPYTQGTVDSNETWVDFEARSGDRIIGRNGALSGPDESGSVDEWGHFVNVHMLDRNGNRINRRNPQDIFTPLYNHQIPPGAGQVVHYRLHVPKDVTAPIELKVRLRYRKFDHEYMSLVFKEKGYVPTLPIVDICEDKVTLPVEGLAAQVPAQTSPIKPAWQRWNDYGIGCLIEGGLGSKKGELKQAAEAFEHMLTLPEKDAHGHGYLNLARVRFDEGKLNEAVDALNKARETDPPAPWWTVAWFTALVNAENGHLDDAIRDLSEIVKPGVQRVERKFDFRRDFVVLNELAKTLLKRSLQEDSVEERDKFVRQAVSWYEQTLKYDSEDLDANYGLSQCFALLGESTPTVGPSNEAGPPTVDSLLAHAKVFTDAKASRESRMQAAGVLCQQIVDFGKLPTKAEKPKLPTYLALIRQCRPLYDPSDKQLEAAAAKVLGCLYRQAHSIYKPDDNAADLTQRLYREKHPAAAAASQAIVIYPTDHLMHKP
jgi:tetratricopeptide (TPR) repeat protein